MDSNRTKERTSLSIDKELLAKIDAIVFKQKSNRSKFFSDAAEKLLKEHNGSV
jgi:metal-responsive CopG/Arc/MetJ family transcriptional regulator